MAREGLELLDRKRDLHGTCRAWFLRGCVAWGAGRAGDADEFWTHAAGCAEGAGTERERYEVIGWQAMAAAQGPTPVEEALGRCEEFGELVRGSPRATVWILHPLALLHAMKEDFECRG